MKKTVTVEKSFCDVCGKVASGYQSCMSCGKEFCYKCEETEAVKYSHAINLSGSNDGFYCKDCDIKLINSKDELHSAYREIKRLKEEQTSWYNDFKCRSGFAELKVKQIREAIK